MAELGMQAAPPTTGGKQTPIWLPPVQTDWLIALILVVIGSNIEMIPEQYHSTIGNPLVFLVGMLVAAGLASVGEHPIAFAIAFCLVNIVRIMPKKQVLEPNPGVTKEGFQPAGTLDWVTTHKKWFVEKVLHERPVAIQEKEVATYPIQS
jgi:hypothetical protein